MFGLSSNRALHGDARYDAVRWQLMIDDVDEIIDICRIQGLPWGIEVEAPTPDHHVRIAKVRSPNGVLVWFEGPNEARAVQ